MKGFLIKEDYGWVVRYKKSEEVSPWFELELHPNDVLTYNTELIEYHDKKINFKITSYYEYDDSECCKNYVNCEHYINCGIGECSKVNTIKKKYAKLNISDKSDNWEDIIDDISDLYGIMVDVRLREYLEQNYNIPIPKLKQDAE